VAVIEKLAAGINVTELAREFKTTRQTIMRIRDAALNTQ
jgi:putative DNA-invertase from lambdoid prophage Rac